MAETSVMLLNGNRNRSNLLIFCAQGYHWIWTPRTGGKTTVWSLEI